MNGRVKAVFGSLLRLFALVLFNALVIFGSAAILPGLHVPTYGDALVIAIFVMTANALLWPLVISLALRFAVFTMGLGSILISGYIVAFATDAVVGGYANIGSAMAAGVLITVANIIASTIFAIGSRDWYYERVVLRAVKRVARKQGREIQETDVPGVFFLEIDGLAEPILRRAITNGHMPTMARWINEGSHRVVGWECDLSSQTSASQAGLLLGSNDDIPAFRWYERDSGRMMTSSSAKDVAEIEARLSNGEGLLAYGGTSRGNLISGDAPRSLLTLSKVKEKLYSRDFYAYFSDPYNPPRTIALGIWDIGTELVEASRQRRLDVRPRVDRGGIYPLLRCGMTVIMRDFNVFSLIGDMYEGVPVSYATFVGYDEVAHHSGIERRDALDTLRRLDQQFARIERLAEFAPRPYKFVVLSDHGQSQGATFLQRFDETLEDVVTRALSADARVAAVASTDEAWGNIGSAVTQITNTEGATATAVRSAVKSRTTEDGVEFGAERESSAQEESIEEGDRPDSIVLASGNLGLVYMPNEPTPLTHEGFERKHPGLITTLATHPGIGFVCLDTESEGPVAIGADGRHYLDDGRIEGTDPLAHFGKHAARHLARNRRFKHAPDIYVVSMYDPASGEVAAFEELVGSHGGLGGTQSEPFALVPSEWSEEPDEIIGAAEMHNVLVDWLAESGLRPARGDSAA